MNEVVKKIIIKAGLGFSLGLLVGGVFMLMEGPPDAYLGATGVWAGILELFVCGVYGLVVMEGQLLYDIEYYSLMRATLTHFLIILFGLFLLGLSFGWQPDDVTVWVIVAVYVVISILVWIIIYLFTKRKVRRINANLRRWKSAHADSRPGHLKK